MEAQGYEVQPYILPACAINAPHRRDRVWFVAFKNAERDGFLCVEFEQKGAENGELRNIGARNCDRLCQQENAWINSDTNSDGQYWCDSKYEINTSQGGKYALNDFKQVGNVSKTRPLIEHANSFGQKLGVYSLESKIAIGKQLGKRDALGVQKNTWHNFPTQPPICGGNDGFPTELDGITFSKWRAESIKAYGNAIVPQAVYQIFKAINEYEKNLH